MADNDEEDKLGGEPLWEPPAPGLLARGELGLAMGVLAMCLSGEGVPRLALGCAMGLWAAVAAGSEWLRRRGARSAARLGLGIRAQALVCALCWVDGGLASAFNAGQLAMVLAAMLFGGRRAAWAMAGAAVGNGVAMWAAQNNGWLPEKMLVGAPLANVLVQCAFAAAVAAGVCSALSRVGHARLAWRRDEEQAREAAEGFEAVFEKSSAPMALTAVASKLGGRYGLVVNGAFKTMMGMGEADRTRPGAISRLWVGEESRAEVLDELFRTGAMEPRRALLARPDGTGVVKCLVSAAGMEWRGEKATLWTAMDISATVDMEERLERSNQEWRAKVEERGVILEHARMELSKRERFSALGEMVAGVAHEVNTPIGNALLSTSALQEPLKRLRAMAQGERVSRSELIGFAQKAQTAAALALENLERASEIIGSFKQLSTDQAGGTRRGYRVERVLGDSLRVLARAFKSKGVQWRLSCAPGIKSMEMDGYPGALSQIATIMAQNVLEHAFGPGARLGERRWEARALVDPADPTRARIEFEDNGSGVEPALMGRVFDPFCTTKASSGSTGLGLSIAWSLAVEALGGSLELENGPQGGAIFVLSIPKCAPGKGG